MADIRLVTQKGGQGVKLLQIGNRIDPVIHPCINRIFKNIQPAKFCLIQISGLARFETLIEVAQEIILQLDLRDTGGKGNNYHRNAEKEPFLVADHKFAKRNHDTVHRRVRAVLLDGDPADQTGKQKHGENPDTDHPAGHHIAKLAEGGRNRKIQRQKSNGCGEDRNGDAKPVIGQGAPRPEGAIRCFLHRLPDGRQDMNAAGNSQRDNHQWCHSGGRIDWHAGPAKRPERDHGRQCSKDQDQQRSGG